MKSEDVSSVQVGDNFWLTTLDYEKFWKLSDENVESLQYVDRQLQAVAVNSFSDDRKSVTNWSILIQALME